MIRIKGFSHGDWDGVASNLLFCKVYSSLGYAHSTESGASGPSIDKKIKEYLNSYEYDKNTIIIITDVCMSYDVAVLLDNLPNPKIHIDHHSTSLDDMSRKDPNKNDFSWSFIQEGDSATMLSYKYLKKSFSDNPAVQDILTSYQYFVAMTDLWDTKPRDSENFVKYRESIMELVTLMNTLGFAGFKARFLMNPSTDLTPEESAGVNATLKVKNTVCKITNVFIRTYKYKDANLLYGVCFGHLYRSEVAEYIFQNNSNLEFLFVIDMNDTKVSLRRANRSTIDLTKIVLQIDPSGGGHPFACGGSFSLDNYKSILDKIFAGDFTLD